ncbi:MAG: DUF1801 domain-containing protein [Acidimicrobiia bacterium]|nr:DUF1801 domain-containing protein [Acidimicrobiia bacterium]NNC74385.1 DUF1801 domain-containing protein [Acidimicrobiia bacterium]
MPGWKSDVGRRLDRLIGEAVTDVRRAVRWNSPFYGIEGQGWFVSFHCFTRYIKVTFLNGAHLTPLPPETSKSGDVRYLHIHENEEVDERQLTDWFAQASSIPGEELF